MDPERFGLLFFNQSLSDYFKKEVGLNIKIGMRPEDLFPPGEFVRKWHEIYHKTLSLGQYTQEYSVYTGTRYLQLNAHLVRKNDKVIGISVFGKDETKRKLIQDALKDNEEKFRLAFMTGLDAFYLASLKEGRIYEINSVFEDVFGYPRQEVIGKTSRELDLYAHPDDRIIVVDALKKQGFVRDLELEGRKKDGTLITISLSIHVMLLKGIEHMLGVIRDITSTKRTEKALREAGERYREIVEGAIEGIYRTSLDGHTLSANLAMAKLLGYDSAQEVLEKVTDWGTQVWVDSAERSSFIALLMERAVIQGYECRFKRKDGGIFQVALNSRMVFGEDGHAMYCEGFIQDITDRKRAEDAAERIRTGFEKGAVAQALTSLDGEFIRVNEAFAKLLHYPPHELEGKHFNDVTHADDRAVGSEMVREMVRTGDAVRFEKRYVTKDGLIVWADVNIAMVRDSGGTPQYFVGTYVDISAHKQAEYKLQKFAEQMKQTLESTTTALSMAMEMRDSYTAGHQRRVTDLACRIWKRLGLSSEAYEGLRIAAMLHDLGKLSIPTDILTKPTRLSAAEIALIREHPLAGWDTLRLVEFPWPVAAIVRQHHERLDGTGYPDGLKGPEIMKEACVLAVADVVEAMASHRPYRAALGLDIALEEIRKGSGTAYCPDVVDACTALFAEEGYTLPLK